MKLLRLSAFFLALPFSLACVRALRAQTSVYGAVGLTDFGISNSGGSTIGFGSDSAGLIGGGFYNFATPGRLTAGVDARATYSPGSHGGDAVLGALRISFIPRENPLRPYFQIGGGVVSTSYRNTVYSNGAIITESARQTGGALELLFGLDIRVNHSFDIRAIEYGAAAGSKAGYGFLDAGVVYHFPTHPTPHP